MPTSFLLPRPVFGRPDAAAAAKLFIVACGAKDAVEACLPVFDVMGQKTFHLGTEPPSANLVKLSGNFLIASVIESLGEALALVGKAGVDQTPICRFPDIDSVCCPCLQDLWRADSRAKVRACRFRGAIRI